MGALRLDSTISCKVNSNPVTIFGHDGVAGHRHGREADFGTDGCNSFKKTLRPEGGAGPESGPRVGNGAVPHFGHACVTGTGHHFGLKIALFHFFFRATARTGRWHFAFMSPTALRFYLIRPGGMAHRIWTQWAARD